MTLEQLADVALGLLLVGWICARQLRWTPVDARRLWTLPAVLAVVGLGQLLRAGGSVLSGTELALLGIEASVAIGTGALMGGITAFRPLVDPERVRAARERSRGGVVPALECRTGWAGVALWTVLILVRIGIAVEAASLGAGALESVGLILLMVALNRTARTAVVLARTGPRTPAGTGTMER
jgi:hypothetical protein